MRPFILFSFLTLTCLFAEEPASDAGKLSHESQAGVVIASGNNDTQTYNVKQTTDYAWSGNLARFTASYLMGRASGVETAKKWDLGVRFERKLVDSLSAFVGYQLDAAPYSGTNLRHTVDLGGKYDFIKEDKNALFAEAGYHVTAETFTVDNGATTSGDLTSHMGRAYVEWRRDSEMGISSKLWVEYLQNFTDTSDFRINVEPSTSVLLSSVFSMKFAYLLNYRKVPAVPGKKNTDSIFTTSLVAKF